MSSIPFMQMYWSDYFGDTRHLTCEQHGAYLQLLGTMWLHGGSLANDPKVLARITGCTPSRWAKIAPEVLEFFSEEDGVLSSNRLKVELEKAQKKTIIRKEAGSKGGKSKSRKTKKTHEANATAKDEQNRGILHNQLGESSVLDKSKNTLTADDGSKTFADFADAYPKRDGINAAAQAWRRLIDEGIDPGEIMTGLKAWAPVWEARICDPKDSFQRQHIRSATRWLDERGWLDPTPDARPAKTVTASWCGPPEIRKAVVRDLSEGAAKSYLDTARWDGERVIPKTQTAFEKLRRVESLRKLIAAPEAA